MKKTILLIYLSAFMLAAFGQGNNRLIGKWQADTAEVTSMYRDSYQFFSDGKFAFKPNEYDGLNPIISINGNYKIVKDTVYLKPLSMKEIIGGHLIRSKSTTLSDIWEIDGGEERTRTLIKNPKQSAIIKIQPDGKVFILDNHKFFKVGSISK